MPNVYQPPDPPTTSGITYVKRAGTSGVRGQLYETKLLSLFYFRALQDDTIEEFHLLFDIIERFHGISFEVLIKGHDNPVTVFLQTQHSANEKHIPKFDLAKYFYSYKKIKQTFDQKREFLFVLFTNANFQTQYSYPLVTSDLSAKLYDILDTGGMVKTLNNEKNGEYLTKKIVIDQITSLAERFADYIADDRKFHEMMSDELVLRYHVILARKVVDLSDMETVIIREGVVRCRFASFRRDFFDNTDKHIMLFRETLYLQIIKQRKLNPAEIRLYMSDFLADPTDAARLSKLIGTVVTYNNGQLEFHKRIKFEPNIKTMDISLATVNKAVELAAIEILSSVKFKVPAAFGNKDLTLSGSDTEIERRIRHLALTMKELLDRSEVSKIVTIDESLNPGFLGLNGGIAGAIGNIFVFDDDTELIKITDNYESVGPLAQKLYEKLRSEINNLHEYTFRFNVDKFPVLSFDRKSYAEKTAGDFLNKLIVYYNQADETNVEEILKSEIEDMQRHQPKYLQAKTDAIVLKLQNLLIQEGLDLGFSIEDIISEPLINLISEPYMNKVKQYDYPFTEDAVRLLNLPDQRSSTIVLTEVCILTVVKVLQHLKRAGDHNVVLDLEYIDSLPANDGHALRAELRNADKGTVLILVCDKMIYSRRQRKTVEKMADAVRNKTIIVVTHPKSFEILHDYFQGIEIILQDKKLSLIDLKIESQNRLINTATAVFPGVEIKLRDLLRGRPSVRASEDEAHKSALGKMKWPLRLDSVIRDADWLAPKLKIREETSPEDEKTSSKVEESEDEAHKSALGKMKWPRRRDNVIRDADWLAPKLKIGEETSPEDEKVSSETTSSEDEESDDASVTSPLTEMKRNLDILAEERAAQAKEKLAQAKEKLKITLAHGDMKWTRQTKSPHEMIIREPSKTTRLADDILKIKEKRSSEDEKTIKSAPAVDEMHGATSAVTSDDPRIDRSFKYFGQDAEQRNMTLRIRQRALERKKRFEAEWADVASTPVVSGVKQITQMRDKQTKETQDLAQETLKITQVESSDDEEEPRKLFGPEYYVIYKNAVFLASEGTVVKLLAKGHELREKLETLEPGQVIKGVNLWRDTPLVVKKEEKNIKVEKSELTYNRLFDFTTAYVYENRQRFPDVHSKEADDLGLQWNHNDDESCKLYLSAVSGTEQFIDHFSYWPLLCALRKFQLKKILIDEVLKIGNIRTDDDKTLAKVLKTNLASAKRIWLRFAGAKLDELQPLIDGTPELQALFSG